MRYLCRVMSGFGAASESMHPWLNTWAGSEGRELYPGTLNVVCQHPIILSGKGISLKKWDYLLQHEFKEYEKYDPCLYPAKLNGMEVWIFRWGWQGDTSGVEIVAEEYLRDKFSLIDGDEVEVEV